MLSEGFWVNGSWHILSCRSGNLDSKISRLTCLEGRNIILSGDSTTRQWYTVLNELLGKPIKTNSAHIFNANIHYPENDINISFIFHPMSVHPHGIFVNLSQVYFEEELLHRIKPNDCENTIIVISPWAHFVGWPWRAFLDYANGIREGVAYVRKVCPNLPIFLKSSHIIEHTPDKTGKNWLSRRISFTLRDILSGLRVNFLNVWDITLSSNYDIKLHMHKKVIIAELELFFQHLHC
ncbi:NXPE family member 3 [Holothuria leucospilota]|uniref:NXPE family member 3 n=1 Tax=Holothuria leucospilota TaxID=206669 RepID=A0A9Q0YIQ4_HOLLE|nr:NXPE family member 3 [Holothuria leucospilota]